MLKKKWLSFAITVTLVATGSAATAVAKTNPEREAAFAAKVREGVGKIGTGEAALVRLKLRDKTKLEGYVTEAGAQSFTVVDAKTKATTVVAYQQVKSVQGNNLSTNKKIAIGVAIAVVAVVVLYSIAKASCNGFCD
jgi:hypothetical protein